LEEKKQGGGESKDTGMVASSSPWFWLLISIVFLQWTLTIEKKIRDGDPPSDVVLIAI
jgi:hypothetical protein